MLLNVGNELSLKRMMVRIGDSDSDLRNLKAREAKCFLYGYNIYWHYLTPSNPIWNTYWHCVSRLFSQLSTLNLCILAWVYSILIFPTYSFHPTVFHSPEDTGVYIILLKKYGVCLESKRQILSLGHTYLKATNFITLDSQNKTLVSLLQIGLEKLAKVPYIYIN